MPLTFAGVVGSDKPGKPIKHQGSSDRDVQAGASSDHWDFHGYIEQVDCLGWDAGLLVPEHGDSALAGGGQLSQPECFVGEFDPDDARTR